MKLPKFKKPSCASCPAMIRIGPPGFENLYCDGFGGKKKRRLPKSGIKRSVASWCPKTISPPTCRILGFADEMTEMIEYLLHRDILSQKNASISAAEHRYMVRCTYPLGMSAKAFCEALESTPAYALFPDEKLSFGEIVEIDDGHNPYYFYYAGSKFLSVPFFDRSRMKEYTAAERS